MFTALCESELSGKRTEISSSITMVEMNMPNLSVQIPDAIRNSLININDDIKIDIDYSKDVDKAIFNLIILFNYDTIGIKQFSYNSFKFKLWDIT